MNSDPRAQIQDPRANRKWSGDELGSQIRALERPELLNYEVDSGGFWGQDPPAAQLTKELLHYTGACGKYLYTYVHKPSVWFGTFVSFTLPCQSLSHKTRVELNTWFSNYFQLELEIRLPSLERERSLVLFCLPAKALLASGGCLRTKGGLSLRNNSFLVATTWRVLPPTKERGRAQSHKARCSQLLKSHGRGRNKLRFAFKSLRVCTVAIITSLSSSVWLFWSTSRIPTSW